jgi:hypothetical protein
LAVVDDRSKTLARPRPRDELPAELVAADDAYTRLIAVAGVNWAYVDDPTAQQREAIQDYIDASRRWIDASQPSEPRDWRRRD